MLWAVLPALLGAGPCDAEVKPLTTRWEHAFALGSGAFFGRGPTPVLSSSLRWLPSYAIDPAGDRRVGAEVGVALENPELDPQLGARFSLYRPIAAFAAGYEIGPEVLVGLRTGHVRLGGDVDLALVKTLRIGLRPGVSLPHGWPVLELVVSYATAPRGRRDTVIVVAPPGAHEDLERWDNWLASRVRIRASALFASPQLDGLEGAAKDSAQRAGDRQCRQREAKLQSVLRASPAPASLDALLETMDRLAPEFAAAVRRARDESGIPADADQATAAAAALRGLRRAAQVEEP